MKRTCKKCGKEFDVCLYNRFSFYCWKCLIEKMEARDKKYFNQSN